MTVNENDRKQMNVNHRYWNEVVAIHSASEFYDVAGFKAGENKLNALERTEVGDVSGKTLLHLQCHFGLDSLSWARLGAQVTAMDYSEEAIRTARQLAAECELDARFLCCNLYDLPQHLEGQFDVVYTSYGVLCWMPDIREWARIAAMYVKPGGTFYIAEFHPFAYVFNDEGTALEYRYPYFQEGSTRWEFSETYTDMNAKLTNQEDFEWFYRMGDVITALIDAGLTIEFMHEHAFTVYRQFPFLEKAEKGVWRFPHDSKPIPLMFSIRAHKPA